MHSLHYVIHSAIHQLFNHSVDHATVVHSIDQLILNHSIGFFHILVTKRSQANLLGVSNELSEVKLQFSSHPEFNILSTPISISGHTILSSVLQSIDSHSSYSEHGVGNSVSNSTHFEISKIQTLEFLLASSSVILSVHNFET